MGDIVKMEVWGREVDVIDLGNGHWMQWLVRIDNEEAEAFEAVAVVPEGKTPFGAYDIHEEDGRITCGWVSWAQVGSWKPSGHSLVSVEPPEISPSLGCRSCPSHGFIKGGKWVDCG